MHVFEYMCDTYWLVRIIVCVHMHDKYDDMSMHIMYITHILCNVEEILCCTLHDVYTCTLCMFVCLECECFTILLHVLYA